MNKLARRLAGLALALLLLGIVVKVSWELGSPPPAASTALPPAVAEAITTAPMATVAPSTKAGT